MSTPSSLASTATRPEGSGICGPYVDARDAAQAVRKALEAPLTGAEVFIIASPDTVMSRPVTELAAEFFPGVPWRRDVGPHETLLDSEKARRMLGYEPRYSWRSEVAAGDQDR